MAAMGTQKKGEELASGEWQQRWVLGSLEEKPVKFVSEWIASRTGPVTFVDKAVGNETGLGKVRNLYFDFFFHSKGQLPGEWVNLMNPVPFVSAGIFPCTGHVNFQPWGTPLAAISLGVFMNWLWNEVGRVAY